MRVTLTIRFASLISASSSSAVGLRGKSVDDRAADAASVVDRPGVNKMGSAYNKLVSEEDDFDDCKCFKWRVDCYKLTADVDSEGNYRPNGTEWRSGC